MKLERRRRAGPAEDSVLLRIVVAAAVELSIVAVVAQGAVHASVAMSALILAPLGYAVSYRRRRNPNLALKILLAAGLLIAMSEFLQSIRLANSVDQARIPLASNVELFRRHGFVIMAEETHAGFSAPTSYAMELALN